MGKKSKQKKQRQQQFPQQSRPTQAMISLPTQAHNAPMQSTPSRLGGLEIGEKYIRRDIVRILILLTIIAIILIALTVVNDRSTVLTTAGKHLSHFLRIQ